MGTKIHYKGRIKDIGLINRLTEDLEDFAGILNWGWRRIGYTNSEFQSHPEVDKSLNRGESILKGIVLDPHEKCEPFSFIFNEEGYLWNRRNRVAESMKKRRYEDEWVHTNTEYSSIEIHISIIKLLKFIKQRYIPELEVRDESGYWETDNIYQLKSAFKNPSASLESGLEMVTLISKNEITNKSPDQIADYIEEIIRKQLGG